MMIRKAGLASRCSSAGEIGFLRKGRDCFSGWANPETASVKLETVALENQTVGPRASMISFDAFVFVFVRFFRTV